MTVAVRRTSCAPGIWLTDVLCNAGPDDATFEEWHATACVAFVTQGGFGYRCSAGSAALGPGAVLLGNARSAYTCTHAAPGGDRCLSFSYSVEVVEDAAACAGGPARFRRGALPAIARRVMEATPHVLLVGDGAEQLAREQGFSPSDLLTSESRAAWEKWRAGRGSALTTSSAHSAAQRAPRHTSTCWRRASAGRRGCFSPACSPSPTSRWKPDLAICRTSSAPSVARPAARRARSGCAAPRGARLPAG